MWLELRKKFLKFTLDKSHFITENVKYEVSASEPREVSASEPREVSASEPREVSASEPREVSVSEPREVSVSEPREVSASEPREVSASEPENKTKTNVELSEKEVTQCKDTMSKCVLSTIDDMKADALKDYKNYYDKSADAKLTSNYLLLCYNFKQTDLNVYYKTEYGVNISGSCAMVASTSVAEYYTRKGFAKTLNYSKYKQIFSSFVSLGIGSGVYDRKKTYCGRLYDVVNKYYCSYDYWGYGKNTTTNIENEISKYNKNKKPVVGHFRAPSGDGHSMVILGYYDVTVKYKKKKSDSKYKTNKIRYYAVNDGWENCKSGDKRVSYIRSSYLTSGITIFK